MQAAFLKAKLPYLDAWNKERNRIAERYLTEICNPSIILPQREADGNYQVWHIFAVRCQQRDQLQAYLEENGIGTNIHYPVPVHMQKCYADLDIPKGSYPVAEEIAETVLSLPMYYGMTEDEIQFVIDALNAYSA